MANPESFDAVGEGNPQPKILPTADEAAEQRKLALEESIKEYVDMKMKEEDPMNNQLLPRAVRREKLFEEVRKTLDFSELEKNVTTALKIFKDEGQRYLSETEYAALLQEIKQMGFRLKSLDVKNLDEERLKSVYDFSPECLNSILKIGVAKFNEGLLPECQSVLTFLTTIKADEPEYEYRLGLVAQKSGQYDIAVRAYEAATNLDPQLIEAHIFAAQCYLNIQQRDNAIKELDKAKNILKSTKVEQDWQEQISNIEILLAA